MLGHDPDCARSANAKARHLAPRGGALRLREVGDVDVVAQARAVGGLVVVAEHVERLPAERRFDREGHQVRFGLVILAQRAEPVDPITELLLMFAARAQHVRTIIEPALVRALTDPISYFLLFWMPLYFQHKHGFDLKQIGMFVWIPYAVAALGNVFSGAMPRYLISRGWELDTASKTTMGLMTCLLLVFSLAAPQIGHPALALALVGGMTFCHGGWGNMTLPAEVFPKLRGLADLVAARQHDGLQEFAFALDLLMQAIVCHAAGEIGGELHGALLAADDFLGLLERFQKLSRGCGNDLFGRHDL